MIVGTAGHIDHGKTTLVKALTGVDTDRLPEEKRRGISIELGYAFLDASDDEAGADGSRPDRIGFVDVPGHERLVATMLAGASGIDHALVVVAADDGVMAQTREHVAALAMLGVAGASLVVSKADRVVPARLAAVRAEAGALLAGTTLAGAPCFFVAAPSGRGIDALRDHLLALARAAARRREDAPLSGVGTGFRLAVDRVFSLAGVGTVATGTAHAGRVVVDDLVLALPAADQGAEPLRVRSLHAQNAKISEAGAGERIAVNLAGAEVARIARGGWLVDPRVASTSARLDVALSVWRDEPRPLRSGSIVHVHIGSGAVLASVAILDVAAEVQASGQGGAGASPTQGSAQAGAGAGIAPGRAGRVQLLLRRPLAAWRGDRVVLRDAAARRIVAGGRVLDPFAPARQRRSAERLAELNACALPSAAERLAAALAATSLGLDLERWRRAEGLLEVPPLPASTLRRSEGDHDSAISAAAAEAWQERIVAVLEVFHRDRPDELGPDPARLRRLAAPRLADPIWRLVLAAAIEHGRVGRVHGLLQLPQHAVALSAVEQRIAQKVLPRLRTGGLDPPWVRTLAADLREPEPLLRAALLRLARRGEVHQVVKDLFYAPATLLHAAGLVRTIAGRDGVVSAAAFRDASGLGRKRAIQIVEYFDRAGLLRRIGDAHRLRADSELFQAAEVQAAA